MIRLPWRRTRAPEPAPAPTWQHRPPEPTVRADRCGQCGDPVPDTSVDGEFCSTLCAAAWLTASQRPVYTCEPPPMIGPRPADEPVPAEPPWMARLTAWERKRAEVVMEPRKVPQATREAA